MSPEAADGQKHLPFVCLLQRGDVKLLHEEECLGYPLNLL